MTNKRFFSLLASAQTRRVTTFLDTLGRKVEPHRQCQWSRRSAHDRLTIWPRPAAWTLSQRDRDRE